MGHELEDLNSSALCPSFVSLLGRGRLLALGKISKRFVCLLLPAIYIPPLKASVHYPFYETEGLFAWSLMLTALLYKNRICILTLNSLVTFAFYKSEGMFVWCLFMSAYGTCVKDLYLHPYLHSSS